MTQSINSGAILGSPVNNSPTAQPLILYFDIIQEHSINLQSQITDNWLENNSPVNDHIANSPLIISLKGISGELIYETSSWVKNITNKISNTLGDSTMDKLSVIPALLPPVDNVTQLAKNAINYVEASYKKYEKIVKKFRNNIEKQSRIQSIFLDLQMLRDNKTALSVETPYATFENMFIQSLVMRQGNTDYMTDIEVTLKQLNYTTTSTTEANEKSRSTFNFQQREPEQDHGYVQGVGESLEEGNGTGVFKLGIEINEYR